MFDASVEAATISRQFVPSDITILVADLDPSLPKSIAQGAL
jgi:hypothetical protein